MDSFLQKFKLLKNSRGNAAVSGMVMAGVTGLVGAGIMKLSLDSKKARHVTRIKAETMLVQSKVQSLFLNSGAINCTTDDGNTTCSVNETLVNTLRKPLSFCDGNSTFCGIDITDRSWDPVSRKYRGTLRYTGTNFQLQPVNFEIEVPLDQLMKQTVACPETAPFFAGLDASGSAQCRALPTDCPANSYIESVDFATMTLTCRSLSDDRSCPSSEQYISSITWNGGIEMGCKSVENPFVHFQFAPEMYQRRYLASGGGGSSTTTIPPTTTTTPPAGVFCQIPGAITVCGSMCRDQSGIPGQDATPGMVTSNGTGETILCNSEGFRCPIGYRKSQYEQFEMSCSYGGGPVETRGGVAVCCVPESPEPQPQCDVPGKITVINPGRSGVVTNANNPGIVNCGYDAGRLSGQTTGTSCPSGYSLCSEEPTIGDSGCSTLHCVPDPNSCAVPTTSGIPGMVPKGEIDWVDDYDPILTGGHCLTRQFRCCDPSNNRYFCSDQLRPIQLCE